MKNQDRSAKVLLGLLVLGVWGLLLKPLITTPLEAQPKATLKKQVMLISSSYYADERRENEEFTGEIKAQLAKGFKIVGYQTTSSGNIPRHHVLMER